MVDLGSNWLIPSLAGLLSDTAVGFAVWILLRCRSGLNSLIADVTRNVSIMLWMIDAGGALIYGNDVWRTFLGITADDDIGRTWEVALHPDDRAAYRKAWRQAMNKHKPVSLEYRLRRSDSVYRWLYENVRRRFDEAGRFKGLVG